MVQLLIGADPEIFLKKGSRNVSAHGVCPGTKKEPHKIKKGAIQLDGTAVEFNIDPASSAKMFSDNIAEVLKGIRKIIPKDFKFQIKPSVKYAQKYFDDDIPPEAKELGCDPDRSAYKAGALNDPPKPVSTIRTGAGHVHIGWTKGLDVNDPSHIADCAMLTRNMDALVRLVEHNWDKDKRRRSMYGKLGSFRVKPYGMEYRSLSNAWVAYPKLHQFIFSLATTAYYQTAQGVDLLDLLVDAKLSPKDFNKYVKDVMYPPPSPMPEDFANEVVKW